MKIIKAHSDIDFQRELKNDLNTGLLTNVKEFQVGSGGKNMRVDSQGLWLGADKFEDAPFSVDMDGNVTATSLSLSDLSGNLDDIADGATYKRAVQNQLTGGDRAYDGLNSSSEIIKGFLNTQLSNKSLPNTGVCIDSDGIYGRKSGSTTFYIDANGDAYFSGDITASTVTGSTITGGTIRTSSSGSRVEITGDDDRIDWYNSSNFNTARFDDTGLYFFKDVEDVGGYLTLDSSDNMVISADGRMEIFGDGGIYTWDDLYADGNILPFSDNAKYVGSSSSRFRKGYFYDFDIDDDLTVGDNASIDGILTVGEHLNMTSADGFVKLPRLSGATASGLSATDGAMYYRTDDDVIRVRLNGSWKTIMTM